MEGFWRLVKTKQVPIGPVSQEYHPALAEALVKISPTGSLTVNLRSERYQDLLVASPQRLSLVTAALFASLHPDILVLPLSMSPLRFELLPSLKFDCPASSECKCNIIRCFSGNSKVLTKYQRIANAAEDAISHLERKQSFLFQTRVLYLHKGDILNCKDWSETEISSLKECEIDLNSENGYLAPNSMFIIVSMLCAAQNTFNFVSDRLLASNVPLEESMLDLSATENWITFLAETNAESIQKLFLNDNNLMDGDVEALYVELQRFDNLKVLDLSFNMFRSLPESINQFCIRRNCKLII